MSMTSPAQWERIGTLFDRLVAMPRGERDAWLDAQPSADPALRAEVRALLRAHDDADVVEVMAHDALRHWIADLAGPELAGDDPADALLDGGRVGPYAVRREIGRGSSAVVYEAVRDGDDEPVALKVLRGAWDATVVARRFRREQRLLARLAHPNIAALRDAGVTADGRSYVALDLVTGEAIDRYCATHRLTLRGRVALLLDVCAAVSHAHRLLVVHRDLKPTNVLVTDDGTAKLLDFGVARVLAPHDDEEAADPLTRPGEQPYTPEYASPEVLRGEPATTTSDVYSLGVILYELLTGLRPHAVAGRSSLEAAETIGAVPPRRVSEVLAAGTAARGLEDEPARLALQARGDLDAIVQVALAADPARRYASVDALADDLRHWLESRAVRVRPAAVTERVRRWMRRHRLAAAVTGVVVPVGLLGIAGTVWQMRAARTAQHVAEQRYEQVRALARALLFDVHDVVADVPGATAVRAQLAERALRNLTRLAAGAPDDPMLQRDLALAFQRVGDARGGPTNANLGDRAAARDAYAHGLALAERAAAARPADVDLASVVVDLRERTTDLRGADGDAPGAMAMARSVVEARRALAARTPTPPRALALGISLVKLGDVAGHPAFVNAGDRATAQAAYEEALTRLDAPPLAGDTSFTVRRYRALVRERLGRMLQLAGDVPGALDTLRRALTLRQGLAAEQPSSVNARRDVAVMHYIIADVLLGHGDAAAAEPHARASLAIRDSLAREDHENVQLRRGLALAHGQLARLAAAGRRPAQARVELSRARVAWASYLGGRPPSSADRLELDSLAAVAARLR